MTDVYLHNWDGRESHKYRLAYFEAAGEDWISPHGMEPLLDWFQEIEREFHRLHYNRPTVEVSIGFRLWFERLFCETANVMLPRPQFFFEALKTRAGLDSRIILYYDSENLFEQLFVTEYAHLGASPTRPEPLK